MKPVRLALLFPLCAGLTIGPALAHPLGNNTQNRQALIRVEPQSIGIHYLLDLAEIPTLLAAQDADQDADGVTTDQEWERVARERAQAIRAGIDLTANGEALVLAITAVR